MIKVSYNRTTNTTGIEIGDLTPLKTKHIKAVFKNIISDEIHYTQYLTSFTWCKWSGAELITDIFFYTENDVLIHHYKWDVLRDGDDIEKSLWIYLKERYDRGDISNGLVIGTHDGRNGHWIYAVKDGLSKATLIDGSEKQFSKMYENYKKNPKLKFLNEIVTVDGGEVTWYQGGEGYTDTVVADLIKDWLPESKITKIVSNSISFKNLILQNDYDWIHLDVEGIDGELILSLEKLPNVIVYESMNLDKITDKKLTEWFEKNNYKVFVCNGNTMAMRQS